MRMMFLNLPVKDLEASKAFFAELGFQLNPRFSDDRFADFINGVGRQSVEAGDGRGPDVRRELPGPRRPRLGAHVHGGTVTLPHEARVA